MELIIALFLFLVADMTVIVIYLCWPEKPNGRPKYAFILAVVCLLVFAVNVVIPTAIFAPSELRLILVIIALMAAVLVLAHFTYNPKSN